LSDDKSAHEQVPQGNCRFTPGCSGVVISTRQYVSENGTECLKNKCHSCNQEDLERRFCPLTEKCLEIDCPGVCKPTRKTEEHGIFVQNYLCTTCCKPKKKMIISDEKQETPRCKTMKKLEDGREEACPGVMTKIDQREKKNGKISEKYRCKKCFSSQTMEKKPQNNPENNLAVPTNHVLQTDLIIKNNTGATLHCKTLRKLQGGGEDACLGVMRKIAEKQKADGKLFQTYSCTECHTMQTVKKNPEKAEENNLNLVIPNADKQPASLKEKEDHHDTIFPGKDKNMAGQNQEKPVNFQQKDKHNLLSALNKGLPQETRPADKAERKTEEVITAPQNLKRSITILIDNRPKNLARKED
jgi:hypothetical protein